MLKTDTINELIGGDDSWKAGIGIAKIKLKLKDLTSKSNMKKE